MDLIESVEKMQNIGDPSPFVYLVSLGFVSFGLLGIGLFFGITFMKAVDKLIDQNKALNEKCTEVIESNTKAVQGLDNTIKDRFLRYFEEQVRNNPTQNDA